MAATSWKRLRLYVDVAVKDASLSEKDFRWAVEQALNDNRTFSQVLARYRDHGTVTRNLTVKVYREPR